VNVRILHAIKCLENEVFLQNEIHHHDAYTKCNNPLLFTSIAFTAIIAHMKFQTKYEINGIVAYKVLQTFSDCNHEPQ